MGSLYAGLITITMLYIASRLWHLNHNYRAARATGLPIVVCPYDPDSVFHAMFSVPLRPVLRCLLPAAIFATVELSIWGWEFRDKAVIHGKLGPAFVFVTTGLNRLVCADPSMAHTILTRRRDFVHPEITTKAMGFLGPNIVTAKDESWSRQRRIVAPALNERISPEVWRESAQQASSLADLLLSSSPSHSADESAQTILGLRTIAINVLARIAYGHRRLFALSPSSRDPAADMSYVDAISMCTELLVPAAFLPINLLRLPVMPQLLQTLGTALKRLPGLTRDMLDHERQGSWPTSPDAGQTTANTNGRPYTIMSTLVRLSDQEKDQIDKKTSIPLEKKRLTTGGSSAPSSYLTEEEIAGNLFIFTAAGFDTTANTMSYAVTLLAAYPEWQAWIQTEIDTVLGDPLGGGLGGEMPLSGYMTAYPKLTRCLAVMLETLRLFPPVTLLMRSNATTQNITYVHASSTSFHLSAPCTVYVNTVALHMSTSTWGPDALEFNPARWLQPVPEEGGEQVLMTPPRGTYLPWSVGPRTCPGQKMSQVEFVTVIATLFRRCTAKPNLRKGESIQQAKQRLLDSLQDSQPILTLQINRPKDISLHWVKR